MPDPFREAADRLRRLERRRDRLHAASQPLREREDHLRLQLDKREVALTSAGRGSFPGLVAGPDGLCYVRVTQERHQQRPGRPPDIAYTHGLARGPEHLDPLAAEVAAARKELAEVRAERAEIAREGQPVAALAAACREELRSRGWKEPRT